MVWMGVDLGKARIGLALSDERLTFALAFDTLTVHGDPIYAIDEVIGHIEDEHVDRVVIGLPLELSSKEGESASFARTWAARLAAALMVETQHAAWTGAGKVDVVLQDERLTSVEAHRQLLESGKSRKDHQGYVDQQAAVLILQSALDTK